jgi:hypothetical protein
MRNDTSGIAEGTADRAVAKGVAFRAESDRIYGVRNTPDDLYNAYIVAASETRACRARLDQAEVAEELAARQAKAAGNCICPQCKEARYLI